MNEELETVNQELKTKIDELSHANSDLLNLMTSTEIGTLFLDRGLRIQRYTPLVADLFNVVPTDRGRPIQHLTHSTDYEDLAADAETVLRDLATLEREVAGPNGSWFLVRLRPYRTVDDVIEGVVITFVDITERKQATEKARNLASVLARAEQQERSRIAQLLHDNLQQQLFGVKYKLASVGWTDASKEEGEVLKDVGEWIDRAIETTRQLTVDLSPPLFGDEGLAEALRWLASQMKRMHGLDVEVEAETAPGPTDPEVLVLLVHAVRELLFNVVKHSGVGRATVRIIEEPGGWRVEVVDRGAGVERARLGGEGIEMAPGFGLGNLRDRLDRLGGELDIHTAPGEGFRVILRLPRGGRAVDESSGSPGEPPGRVPQGERAEAEESERS